jgi:chromosome segregation ATPase
VDEEILDVLKQIRDEAKGTNQRLESLESRVDVTNQRLQSVESRLQFVEKGFADAVRDFSGRMGKFEERLNAIVDRLDQLWRRQSDSELRLATEVLSLSNVTREVRDLLATRLDDHATVAAHEDRLRKLEDTIADRDNDR